MPATQRRQRQTVSSVENLRQRLRQQSEFEKETGWCQFYHAWRAELPRLCSGLSCRSLIDAVSSEINIQAAKAKKAGCQLSEWSPDLDKQELALECCSDKRTVDRDIKYLESSGMAQVRHSIRGTVSIRLMYRDWRNLPDYAPPDRPEPSPVDETKAKETFELVKAPRSVKAGEFSERLKVACAVSSFRFQAAGAVDLAFTAVVKGGEFLVTSREVDAKKNPQVEKSTASNGFNKLDGGLRHGRLGSDDFHKSFQQGKEGEQGAKERNKGEHPRAAELARLFDPILLRSSQRSLSADPVAFASALDVLGDLSHDFLVKFVIQRAERPISSPKVCASILKEARANWEKVKDLPDAERIPPQRQRKMSPLEEARQWVKEHPGARSGSK